jgi:hypothetical protein
MVCPRLTKKQSGSIEQRQHDVNTFVLPFYLNTTIRKSFVYSKKDEIDKNLTAFIYSFIGIQYVS